MQQYQGKGDHHEWGDGTGEKHRVDVHSPPEVRQEEEGEAKARHDERSNERE